MDFNSANIAVAVVGILVSASLSFVAYRAAVRQNRLSASSIAVNWIGDLRSWASEAIDVLAEAAYTCRRDDRDSTSAEIACIQRCRHRLSALIDRGRFLLPNERELEHGGHKPRAYRGLRHHALDALVAAERILSGDLPLGRFPDRKRALIGLRREFVSAIQSIIDPQSHNQEVARMLQTAHEARAKDPTLGGLLPDAKNIPTGAAGILDTAGRRYEALLASPSRD